mgnify:CR=1 FL=1
MRRALPDEINEPTISKVEADAQPIMFIVLFVYVFGSAMKVPGGGDYTPFLMPGMFVMTMAFGFINTATLVVRPIIARLANDVTSWSG